MLNFTLDNKKETHVFISPDQRFGLWIFVVYSQYLFWIDQNLWTIRWNLWVVASFLLFLSSFDYRRIFAGVLTLNTWLKFFSCHHAISSNGTNQWDLVFSLILLRWPCEWLRHHWNFLLHPFYCLKYKM
jgi:hypothetical protein